MKLKQQEMARLLLFLTVYGSSFIANMNVNEISEFLATYNLTIEDIQKASTILSTITICGANWMEFVTKEHKTIQKNYNEVIKNASDLFKMIEVHNDPVKSFALYVYLYREGYLSWNHQFLYSFYSKDFARLSGVDVISGKGVCRAISSLFTDICKQNEMNASNVAVKVNEKRFDDLKKLCPISLKCDNTGKIHYGNILGTLISYLPLGNHITTHVSFNGMKYDFDPTNDILLTYKNGKLYISDSAKSYITYNIISNFFPMIFGQLNIDLCASIQDNMLPTISHNEYIRIYRETLEMIKENVDVFEKFYQDNKDIYYEIASIANKQHSAVKRLIPILPIK